MTPKMFIHIGVLTLLLSGAISLVAQTEAPVANAAPTEEAIKLETLTGTLYGTLLVPRSKSPIPVVLIIAGSGPTDRNGNFTPQLPVANNGLKMLAEKLAESGIASLRYDKRGIGESAKAVSAEADLRFETYVNDAKLWAKRLRIDDRFSTLTIVGHSEGSLIGMIAAGNVGAEAYVSIAGVGRPANQLIHDQLKPQLTPEKMAAADDALSTLAAGKTLSSFPPELESLLRPSVQPYMISWFHYDPANEIAKLKIPVLIVQGTTDIQVTVADAKTLAKAYPSAKLLLIEGMNHVFKDVSLDPAQQSKAYGDPLLPIDVTLVRETIDFVKKVKKTKS